MRAGRRRSEIRTGYHCDISASPYAGTIQVRFNGYDLRPWATPLQKMHALLMCIEELGLLVNDSLHARGQAAVNRQTAR